MQSLKYRTTAASSTGDFRDRGSKFFSFQYPVQTVEQTKEHIARLKKEHPKAVHFCYAFRLGNDGNSFRANDDGEPSGSAGKPILGQIDSAALTDILVVVVRYFGGTLLGVPGLINAYKTATSLALEHTTIIEKWKEKRITISFDYPVMGEVLYLLKQNEAAIYKQELQLFCNIVAGIPQHLADTCMEKLSEIRGLVVEKPGH